MRSPRHRSEGLHTDSMERCITVFFVLLLAKKCEAHSGPELTSDACHGSKKNNLTHNVLECNNTGDVICITEVRFYQHDTSSKCPNKLDKGDGTGCCSRNESRCSWIRKLEDDREKLQRNCSGVNRCDLHSASPQLIGGSCFDMHSIKDGSQYSSVRSIKFKCISDDALCTSPTSTPSGQKTSENPSGKGEPSASGTTSSPSPSGSASFTSASGSPGIPSASYLTSSTDMAMQSGISFSTTAESLNQEDMEDTGVIVGLVLGGVAVGIIAAVLLVVYFRRRKLKNSAANGCSEMATSRPTTAPNYYNVGLTETAYQNFAANGGTEMTNSTAPNYYNVGFTDDSIQSDQYSLSKLNVYQPMEDDVSVFYSRVSKDPTKELEYAEPDVSEKSRPQPSTGEYSHVVGDQGSFPGHSEGHYNHVATNNTTGECSPDNNTGHYFEVKGTYDKLDRAHASNVAQNEKDDASNPYNVLDKFNVVTGE